MLGFGSAGWSFAILAWVAMGHLLDIGLFEFSNAVRPSVDLVSGSPPPPPWVAGAWRRVSGVAVLGWALGFSRRAWPHRLAVSVFLGVSALAFFGIIGATELDRMRWVHARFINGEIVTSDSPLHMQLLHTYASVQVMVTVLVGALLLASSRLPRAPSGVGIVAATLAPLVACTVAEGWLVSPDAQRELVRWLPDLVAPIWIIAGLAFVLTASVALAQARYWPCDRPRGSKTIAALLCCSGLVAFVDRAVGGQAASRSVREVASVAVAKRGALNEMMVERPPIGLGEALEAHPHAGRQLVGAIPRRAHPRDGRLGRDAVPVGQDKREDQLCADGQRRVGGDKEPALRDVVGASGEKTVVAFEAHLHLQLGAGGGASLGLGGWQRGFYARRRQEKGLRGLVGPSCARRCALTERDSGRMDLRQRSAEPARDALSSDPTVLLQEPSERAVGLDEAGMNLVPSFDLRRVERRHDGRQLGREIGVIHVHGVHQRGDLSARVASCCEPGALELVGQRAHAS